MTSRCLRAGIQAILVALAGCSEHATSPDELGLPVRDASPVQTDALEYQLVRSSGQYRAWARATYRNTTGAPVHFKRCSMADTLPMFGIRRTGADSTRRYFQDWAWACVGGVPTGTVLPGRMVTVIVPLGSLDQPNMQPPLLPEHLTGLLRVELHLCAAAATDSDRCVMRPVAERRSNAFLVRY